VAVDSIGAAAGANLAGVDLVRTGLAGIDSATVNLAAINLAGISTEALIGFGSAALALLGAIVSGFMAGRARRQAHQLDRQRRLETRAEAADRILAQYRDPLLDASHTLQARLYNIVAQNYLGRYLNCGDPDEERYARDYTVFGVAEYLCWVEIVRRELRFHDLGDDERTRKLLGALTATQVSFQSDRINAPLRLFRGRQRAIAELMTVPTNATEGPRTECMGYAAFCQRLDDDPDFRIWFAQLRADVDAVAQGGPAFARVARIQQDLVDLLDLLDKDAVRVPAQFRQRLTDIADAGSSGGGAPQPNSASRSAANARNA
jgi:hypothetical protein